MLFLLFCNYRPEKRAGCFTFVVFRMLCRGYHSLTLPRGAVGKFLVSDNIFRPPDESAY